MKLPIILLLILAMSSCNQSNQPGTKAEQEKIQSSLIDTILDGHRTMITLNKPYLLNGVENKILIEIKGVENDEIVIYTSTSEATVKAGIKPGEFVIVPKMEVAKVKLMLNKLGMEGLQKLGTVNLKTST